MRSRTETERGLKIGTHLLEVDALSIFMIAISISILAGGLLTSDESIYRVSIIYLSICIAGISLASVSGGFKVDNVLSKVEFLAVMKYSLLAVIGIFIVQAIVFGVSEPSTATSFVSLMLIFAGATSEEVFFRGGIFNVQSALYPNLSFMVLPPLFISLLFNNVIFAIYHYSKMMYLFGRVSVPYLLAIFFSGFVITVAGVITRKLATCIIAHSVFNMIAMYSGKVSILAIGTPEGVISAFYYTIFIAFVSSLYRYLYEHKRKDFLRTQKGFVFLLVLGATTFPIAVLVSPWLGAILVSVLLFQIFSKIEMFVKKRNHKKEEPVFPYYPKEKVISIITTKLGGEVNAQKEEGEEIIQEAGS